MAKKKWGYLEANGGASPGRGGAGGTRRTRHASRGDRYVPLRAESARGRRRRQGGISAGGAQRAHMGARERASGACRRALRVHES